MITIGPILILAGLALGYYGIFILRDGHDNSGELFLLDWFGDDVRRFQVSPEDEMMMRDCAGDAAVDQYMRSLN